MQMNNKQKYTYIFFAAIGFRIIMYLIAALIMAFKIKDTTFTLETFLSNWCRWDANHYMNIATNGYRGAVEFCDTCRQAALAKGLSPDSMQNGQHLFLVFFPLYPFLLGFFNLIFTDIRIAGLVLSTLAYAAGCVNMYRLVKLDYSDEVARNSVILLSLFPFGFFFGGIMTESLFFFISASMLYCIRNHDWKKVILWGCLATMVRLQGVLLIIPAGLELLCFYKPWDAIRNRHFSKLKEFLSRGLSLCLMFIGVGVYLFINWQVEGNPFAFMIYQNSHWHQGAGSPIETLSYIFRYAFSTDYNLQTRFSLWIPQAMLAVFSVGILIYGIKKLKLFHAGYAIAYVLLTYSATWLISAGRYLSCCIPLFIALAITTERKKWLMPVFISAFSMLLIIYYTGYFNGMQIM